MAGRASRCFLLASSELNPQRTTALCYPDSQVPYCRLANSVVDMILLLSRPQAPLLALINQQFAKVQKLSNTGWGLSCCFHSPIYATKPCLWLK